MTKEDWIFKVVSSFYDKAKTDILIGYHFRNISDFDEHIPRIAHFWELQLLGKSSKKTEPFDVMNKHIPLGIKKGELGRWLLLFRKTLDEQGEANPEFHDFKLTWEQKLVVFESIFTKFFNF